MPPSPSQLHYAPSHRRWIRARWLVLLALAAALLLGSRWAPPLWRQAQLRYWERRCLGFSFPPGQVTLTLPPAPKPFRPVIPLPWNQFYSYFSPPGLKSDGTVFLHERTSPAGHHRLIAVDLYDIQSAPTQIMCFARVIDLGGIFITGDQRPQPSEGMFTLPLPNPHCLIFAGTPDPADPSHFTFTISTGSDQRTIDGWLRDDDRVVMELRKPTVQNP